MGRFLGKPGFLLVHVILLGFLFHMNCRKDTAPYPADGGAEGYPRLAMWWPDTWKQPVSDLARYDWIGFGEWDNMATVAALKQANPNQKHFMDFSITETSWSWWEDKKTLVEKIPAEWFLTQRGARLAQPLDGQQTTVFVDTITTADGMRLFEIGDIVACQLESMKVLEVDENAKSLTVQRGFVRSAAPHPAGSRIAPHITFWPESWVMNMSRMCPMVDLNDGAGAQRWVDFAGRHFAPAGEWDGYIVDRIEKEQSWLVPRWCRSIDPDCSNSKVHDGYAAFDAAWYLGCADFLDFLRELFPGKAIISNSSGALYLKLNSAIYEGFPGNWSNTIPETYQDWADRALGENGYLNVSKSGFTPNYSLVETYEDEEGPEGGLAYDNPFEHPDFVPNYRKMRFGLATALLGDGYFSYEINTNGHGALGLMWFDEYDNGGKQRGYLGQPNGAARKILQAGDGWVWRRDFERGMVICNPTTAPATVDLGGEYRLIKGTQLPAVNSGAKVSHVTLQPGDGRILLKN
ncbi:MAG: hypothetical protein Kow0042_00330 [Calditrichia bacterium]